MRNKPTIQDQINLELEAIDRGKENYWRKVNNTPFTELTVGMRLLKESITPLIREIEVYRNTPIRGKGNRVRLTMNVLNIPSDEIAFITLKACFERLHERPMLTAICFAVTQMLLDHHEYKKFKTENPGYLFKLEKDLKTSTMRHKRTVTMLKKRKLGISDTELSTEDKLLLGQKLINLLVTTTRLFEKVHEGKGKNSERWYLEGTALALDWVQHQHDMCEALTPFYLPTIIEPKDWESPDNGGYHSIKLIERTDLVKTRNKTAITALRKHKMDGVYSAINSVQKTAWRVNGKILNVLRAVWNSNGTLGDLPPREDLPLPPELWSTKEEGDRFKEEHPEEFIAWKRTRTPIYEANKRLKSKRISITNRIKLAEKFLAYEHFYYPYCLDFRGRVYPIPSVAGMNPQGDDTGKALLEFADGKA